MPSRIVRLLISLGGLCLALSVAPRATAQTQRLVEEEIRYRQPQAGEVSIIWGLGETWEALPKEQRPSGTVIANAVMVTPMVRDSEKFVAMLRAPLRATIHYGFLVTKTKDGRRIQELWDGGSPSRPYRVFATGEGAPWTITAQDDLANAVAATSLWQAGFCFLIGLVALIGLGLGVLRVPLKDRQAIQWVLMALTILGLAVRLWAAWARNQQVPDTAARLMGDELGYSELAVSLLHGEFFEWPGRMPVYPIFLAACFRLFGISYAKVLYVQAIVGALVVPLTFVFARRFTAARGALLAAALVAVHYALVVQTQFLMSENLYTPLLLLAVIALQRAVEAPKTRRWVRAGALLALATLCRPTSAWMPILLLWLLPRAWPLRQKVTATAAYLLAMAAVMAPWTYHNYQTFHRLMPLTVPGAVVLQASPEYYHLIQEKRRTSVQAFQHELNPERNGGYNPLSIEGSEHFTKRGLDSIRAEPLVYLGYSLQKFIFYWIGNPHADWPKLAMFDLRAWTPYFPAHEIAGHLAVRLLPLLALVSLFFLRTRLREFAVPLAVLAYFSLMHMMLYAEIRHSEPLHPILVVLVAATLHMRWAAREHHVEEDQWREDDATLRTIPQPI